MSVILDALRRSRNRRDGADRDAPQRRVPAAFGLEPSSSAVAGSQRRWLALGVLLVIGLGAWALIRVGRVFIRSDAPAATRSASAPAPTRPAAPEAVPVGPSSAPAAGGATATPPPANRDESPVVLRTGPNAKPDREAVPSSDEQKNLVDDFRLAVRDQTLGNDEEALKHYRAALAANPLNVQAYNNLGLLFHRRGATAEAIDQFRRAIAIDPRYVKARSNLAVALMNAGRLSEARAEVRAALAIEPRNADLIVNLALIEQADRHRDQAIELLVRAIGDQPSNALAHYNLAVAYDAQGAVARASDHYAEFIAHAGPEHAALVSEVQRRVATLTQDRVPQ